MAMCSPHGARTGVDAAAREEGSWRQDQDWQRMPNVTVQATVHEGRTTARPGSRPSCRRRRLTIHLRHRLLAVAGAGDLLRRERGVERAHLVATHPHLRG